MPGHISTILHCSGKNQETSLWFALPPTLAHYNQEGTKNTTPNLERRNGIGGLFVLAICQHEKTYEKNYFKKWALIKQTIWWHGGSMWQSRLLTSWKPGSKERESVKVTRDKRQPTKTTYSRSPSSFNLASVPDSASTGLQVCFNGRALAQHAGGCVPSNTHTVLQPNQTTKVSTGGVQKQAKYLSALLSQ